MVLPIETILEDGVRAPSGENCQPWKFKVDSNTLSVFNIPEADQSLYNSQQKGSYVAHGALLENITISANRHGYVAHVTLFPKKDDETHVADVFFEESEAAKDSLYDAIYTRCTNRKDYSGEKITDKEKNELILSLQDVGSTSLVIIDDKKLMQTIGRALAVNEQILFENKKIHDFFYSHIIWNKKDENKAGGFFIDTLEFLPHQRGAVKLFKNWFFLSLLNRIVGVSKKISKENAEKYSRSGSFGAISTADPSPSGWVNVGRNMQRVWLTTEKLGLALHPCNGTIYFMEQIADGGEGNFSKKHSTLIKRAYQDIMEGFNVREKHIAFIFRIGRAEAPSARAKRLQPSIVYTSTP